jgi:hypothetical protein
MQAPTTETKYVIALLLEVIADNNHEYPTVPHDNCQHCMNIEKGYAMLRTLSA